MKKKLATAAIALLAVLSLTACDSKCKQSGCDKDATQDGYCDMHYAMNQLGGLLGGLGL